MAFVKLTIVRAELLRVSVPLRVPFAISSGVMTHRRSLVVVLESDAGVRGFGEAAPFEMPFYSAETFESAKACLGMGFQRIKIKVRDASTRWVSAGYRRSATRLTSGRRRGGSRPAPTWSRSK